MLYLLVMFEKILGIYHLLVQLVEIILLTYKIPYNLAIVFLFLFLNSENGRKELSNFTFIFASFAAQVNISTFQKWEFGNLGIFEQASAKPSLLELCRAPPKIKNAVRNLSKRAQSQTCLSYAERLQKSRTQFVKWEKHANLTDNVLLKTNL